MILNQETKLNTNDSGGKMICTKEGCEKPIQAPLELFDGKLACPYCGSVLTHKFTVNEWNDNLFRLSQAYYFQYLAAAAKAKQLTDAMKKDLANAVKYCHEAAISGHPEACVKMGFYWETGYKQETKSSKRFMMAIWYYEEVCRLDDREKDVVERGEDGTILVRDYKDNARKKLLAVKKEAAVRLYKLLVAERDSLKNMGINPDEKLQELKNKVGEYGDETFVSPKTSREELVFRTLKAAKENVGDAPVFGYFIMSVDDLKNAYGNKPVSATEKGKTGKKVSNKIYELMGREGKLELKYAFLSYLVDGDDSNNEFRSITDDAESLPDGTNEKVVVAFINGAWSPKPPKAIGKKKTKILNKLSTLLFKDDEPTDSFLDICRADGADFSRIFYADDLYYGCLKNAKNPIEGIFQYIQNGTGDNQ